MFSRAQTKNLYSAKGQPANSPPFNQIKTQARPPPAPSSFKFPKGCHLSKTYSRYVSYVCISVVKHWTFMPEKERKKELDRRKKLLFGFLDVEKRIM
jgi:hypothetical protein